MNRNVINRLRASLIGKIRDAIRPEPDGPITEERSQATVEALLASAAAVRFARHRVYFDKAVCRAAVRAADEALGRVIKGDGNPN